MNIANSENSKFGRIILVVSNIILLLTSVISILTGGFTVWDRFFQKVEQKIHLDITPLVINYDSLYNTKDATLTLKIETADGTYKLLDDFKIDSLVIFEQFLLKDTYGEPALKFEYAIKNRHFLDPTKPDILILIKLRLDFNIEWRSFDKYDDVKLTEIGYFVINVPYEFDNKKIHNLIRSKIYVKES